MRTILSRPTPLALLGPCVLLIAGCAHRTMTPQRTTTTSAKIEAGYREAEVAAGEVTLGKYTEALARADVAVSLAPNNPWARYNRAAALHHLGRADAAVSAYRDAEMRFGDDRQGKSISIYGRARALDDVGRCDEAKQAYEEFASLVRPTDAPAADMALAYANQCRSAQPAPGPDAPVLAEMTSALLAGRYARVIDLKNTLPPSAPPNPWIDYDLGSAFLGLGRTDDAVAAFARAEQQFGDRDRWGHSVATWGRARALSLDGRCREAQEAFDDFAKVVGASDPAAVRMADDYAKRCS